MTTAQLIEYWKTTEDKIDREDLKAIIHAILPVYEKAYAFVQVWENSPILLNSETGGALADAVNLIRVRDSSESSKGAK